MSIGAVLLDLEGVLHQDGVALPGSVEAVAALRVAGLGLRFLTNTTTRPRSAIATRLRAMGFAVDDGEIFTPALAARGVLIDLGVARVHLAAPPVLAEDFAGFSLVETAPEAVVMGDLHTGFSWQRLDGLFGMIIDGARLVALHKNRYCRREGRLALDLGPFVAALEYAAEVEAEVVGKPSPAFFRLGLASLGVEPVAAVMVGDDLIADIGGAQSAGIRAVQVETGKYDPRDRDHPRIEPDARIPSIAALPGWIAARESG